MELAPTPRDTLHRDGTAALYRFRRPQRHAAAAEAALPLLIVPSMINRWYVVDLRRGSSMVEALVGAGIDTFCLDWGVPEDEDRYLSWDDVLARLSRAARVVRRLTGAPRIGVLGYCMGGTLAGIHAALEPERVAALVNLAGPFDFSKAGFLGEMVDARYFDAAAIGAAGAHEVFQARQRIFESMDQMGGDGADGIDPRGQGQFTVGAQEVGGARGEPGVGALHAAEGDPQTNGQNHRAGEKLQSGLSQQFFIEGGELRGDAAAIHHELGHAGELFLVLGAEGHFHHQQGHGVTIGLGNRRGQHVVLSKIRPGVKMTDGLQLAQGRQVA